VRRIRDGNVVPSSMADAGASAEYFHDALGLVMYS